MQNELGIDETAERLNSQELMIQGLRGHVMAMDHAVRLLIAGCPDIEIIRSAWAGISADLAASREHSASAEGIVYNQALLQCTDRIAKQLNVSIDFRAVTGDGMR